MMKKIFNIRILFLVCLVTSIGLATSCNKEEGNAGVTILNSFGPSPVARGAELRFIGENLDAVTSIVLPDNLVIDASAFGSKTSTLLTITVPQNAMPGVVTLKTLAGDIITKTRLSFLEPISIASFSPTSIKADSVLTITGDYLNLVKQVIFTDRVVVKDSMFISQSRQEIKLKVPAEAQTGKIAVSNGASDPVIVYSTTDLTVKLPGITTINPNPVKAGTELTINGTNLDLVKTVIFGGNKSVVSFISQSLTKLVLKVPTDAQNDTIKVVPASGVNVKSSVPLKMVVPTVSVSPLTVKNGSDITVTGTDLDLIDHVVFGGNKQGTIKAGGTSTQIVVTVPNDAVSGEVDFVTKANTVIGPSLTIISPVFSSFSPESSRSNADIVITGTDLDLVTDVVFTGGVNGIIGTRSSTQMTVTVPVGAKSGNITLTTINGSQVQSPTAFTLNANLPTITSFTEAKGTPGKILTLNGTNLSLIKQMVFPGNIVATDYGTKTDTKVEVYVPSNEDYCGLGQISILTYEGDQGLTPQIFMGTIDPVADPSKIIVDGTNTAIPGDWGGNIEVVNAPTQSGYFGNVVHGKATALTGWAWIWGNNWYSFPSVSSSDYVLKMDVKITKPLGGSNVHFQMELGGNRIDLGSFGTPTTDTTNGWITVTYDLSSLGGITIPSGGEWGINFWYGTGAVDISGLYMDNLRFEHK